VAETFPEIKLTVLLEAEKLFYESDINNDGVSSILYLEYQAL